MNPSIVQEIGILKEFLNQQNDLGIVIGVHQNLDIYAAALGLYLSLIQSGKNVQIISKKAPTVEVSSLVGIDKIKENFVASNTSKLVISLPYVKGEVEKVLFTEFPDPQNPTNINFHLTAAQGRNITPFDQKDVKIIWEGGTPAAIITIGVGNMDELQGVVDQNSSKIVNIDCFAANSRFGEVVIVDESFSSLSEVVGKIIKELNLPSDIDSAQNILDGVLYATKNFTKPNTSPLAFEAASSAMYLGAQRKSEERSEFAQPFQPRQNVVSQDRNRDQRQVPNNNRSQRVVDTDFPAVHMQNRQTHPNMTQRSQVRPQQQNVVRSNQQFGQNRPQNRPQQQFGQNSKDIEELMRKINEENARKSGGGQAFGQTKQPVQQQNYNQTQNNEEQNMQPPIEDAELVNDPIQPQINQPIEDTRVPEAQNYGGTIPDEIPDDWLMPKVFKSSKNNN